MCVAYCNMRSRDQATHTKSSIYGSYKNEAVTLQHIFVSFTPETIPIPNQQKITIQSKTESNRQRIPAAAIQHHRVGEFSKA